MELTIPSSAGIDLSATLDMPKGEARAWALFSHCFTGNRHFPASSRISKTLAENGIACMRFDYQGLGESGGDFAHSSVTNNVQDLITVAQYMEKNFQAPDLLVGHSLGGAIAMIAAPEIPSIKAIATVGTPFDPAHIVYFFAENIAEIDKAGKMRVMISGRPFDISRSYLEDLAELNPEAYIPRIHKPLLIIHSPTDQIVGIDNAQKIFLMARYPKSLIALDKADHMLTIKGSAQWAARLITTWMEPYV